MLVEWAIARSDSIETIRRAQEVMLEPHPGGVHDDHLHVRTTCTPDETVEGCEPSGPRRAWLSQDAPPPDDRNQDLVVALLLPLETSASPSGIGRATHEAATATSRAKSPP
jgi:hypothetical protein